MVLFNLDLHVDVQQALQPFHSWPKSRFVCHQCMRLVIVKKNMPQVIATYMTYPRILIWFEVRTGGETNILWSDPVSDTDARVVRPYQFDC